MPAEAKLKLPGLALAAAIRLPRLLKRFEGAVTTTRGCCPREATGTKFLSDPTAGEIRIRCPEILSYGLLPGVIDQLSRRHPQIVVRIVPLNIDSFNFFDLLQERRVDLVIARIPRSSVNDDLDIEALLDDKLLVIVGAQNAWARKRKVALPELVKERWILPPTPYVRTFIKEAFEAHGLQAPSERVAAHSIQLRIQLLATGGFVSVLPDSILQENAERWSLKALPIDLRGNPPPWSIIKLKNRTVGPVVHLFIDHLRVVAKTRSDQAKNRKSRTDLL
jgi:DNA-binding transcriptional LysR family regulator